ncbi:hypothetical protein CI610_02800 [invertebrate metagenome]|uniref:Endonuclease/exonuclease/phosphatase domain-containing protein n=1 Tax=invertebrate metagenome TaxID=1711999 RepID=A0A2H9T4Y4_9ZZZZ
MSVYVSNNLSSKRRPDLELPSIECVWLELSLAGKPTLYGTFYRPPNAPVSCWDHIAHSIELAFNTGISNIIITGDFNANLLSDNNHSTHLRNLLTTLNLTQSVASPTFFTESSSSLLDIVCASDPSLVNICHVGESFLDQPLRYHCPIYGSINISKPTQKCFKRSIWLYDHGDYNDYRDRLSQIDWDTIFDYADIDKSTNQLTDIILSTAKKCIPFKTITVRNNSPAWLTNMVRRMIRKRKYLHRKAKRSGNEDDWANFRKLRNLCVNAIRKSKSNYFNKLYNKLNNNTNTSARDWWKIVNNFMTNSFEKSSIPPITVNNSIIYDDLEKANAFNNFFSSQSTINDTNIHPPDLLQPPHTLANIVISRQDVLDAIHSLNTRKAAGPDLISPRLIKEAADILSYPLQLVFNLSLTSSTFPSPWKKAHVTPVFKKDDPSVISNYRPISLLSIIGKLMERCVYKYVYNFLIDKSLLTPYQSGFRSGDSTINQLLSISHDIFSNLD